MLHADRTPKMFTWILGLACLAMGACSSAPPATSAADQPERAQTPGGEAALSGEQREILAKIDAFLAAPSMGETPREINRFMVNSPDVMVVIRQGLVPMPAERSEKTALVLAGFVAGNVRSQLLSGKKGDAPLEGVRGMLAVYRKLQASSPDWKVAEYEELASLERAGSLESHVQEVVSADK